MSKCQRYPQYPNEFVSYTHLQYHQPKCIVAKIHKYTKNIISSRNRINLNMKTFNRIFFFIGIAALLVSCSKDEYENTYHFSSDRIGVCSWSWKSDMNTILNAMETMGITGIQLATTPWVAGDLSNAQKEIFGYEESSDVLDRIKQLSKTGKLNIMSAMICFPHEDYTSLQTIWNTSGFMFTEDGLGHSADEEWMTNRSLVSAAAKLASELNIPYLSTEVGFVNKDWNLALERVKDACDICSTEGVTFLIESGQESGTEMKKFLEDLEKKYPETKIGVNFDPANHILYDTDTPNNAFDILQPWIKQVHVKDCLLDASRRKSWSEDIVWGTGDVSGKFDFLQHVYDSGYKGNLLVEHESGDNRVADIEVALKALLK